LLDFTAIILNPFLQIINVLGHYMPFIFNSLILMSAPYVK